MLLPDYRQHWKEIATQTLQGFLILLAKKNNFFLKIRNKYLTSIFL